MKKIIIAALILIALLIFSAGCIDTKPTYKAGFDPAHPPYTETTSHGEKIGLDYEALMWIAENQGFNVEFVDVPIGSFNDYLADGSIDMFYSGVTLTEEREKLADYSEVYLDSNLIAIGKKSGDITVEDVLSGDVRVSGLKGSVGLKWFEALVGSEKYQEMIDSGDVIIRITFNGALQDVESGISDVAITNDATAENYLKERPHLENLGILKQDTQKAAAVAKGNTELLNKINAGLKNLMATEYWTGLLHKYEIPAKQSKYRVGIDDTHSPYSYKDDEGNLIGFDVEAIEWIADKYDFEVEFVDLSWGRLINAVYDGIVDMSYTGITITANRENYVTFSDPCYTVGMAVAKLKTNPATMDDFASRSLVIGVKDETTPEKWIESFYGEDVFESMLKSGKIVNYDETPDVIEALESGEVDVIVMTDLTMNTQIQDKDIIEIIHVYEDVEELGIAFANGNIALQYILNDGLKELMESGKYDELRTKYKML